LNKVIDFLIVLIIGSLIGFNLSLTFLIAPAIFSKFDHRVAGEIMNTIFPYYFGSGWILGILIYTLFGIRSIKDKGLVKRAKGFVIALGVMILSYMALHKSILPIAQGINYQYYQMLDEGKKEEAKKLKDSFKTVHSISSVVNLFNLLLGMYLLYTYLFKVMGRERETT